MQIKLRRKGSITILDIAGRLMGVEAWSLKEIISRQIQNVDSKAASKKNVNIILNMERVQMMDSCGLGMLVAFHTTIQRSKGSMVLLNLSDKVKDLIVMAKLMIIFDCYETEQEAIAGIVRA